MLSAFSYAKSVKLAIVLVAGLALGACASKTDEAGAGGAGSRLGGGSGVGGAGGPPGSVGEFTASVGDRVFFETDSSELTSAGIATLDKQAQWLTRYGRYAFTISGHADERGTREYNFALGARRADTVKNYLVAKGISASRMRTTSYGKEQPVATCDDISCWSQNRRAVTILSGGGA